MSSKHPTYICGGLLAVAVAFGGGAAPALAQRLGQATVAETPLWRVVAALLLCLALAVAGSLALRVRARGGASLFLPANWRLPFAGPAALFSAEHRRLQLVETLRLGHQVDICLVKCDERHFIVAATPQGATVLSGAEPFVRPGDAP